MGDLEIFRLLNCGVHINAATIRDMVCELISSGDVASDTICNAPQYIGMDIGTCRETLRMALQANQMLLQAFATMDSSAGE